MRSDPMSVLPSSAAPPSTPRRAGLAPALAALFFAGFAAAVPAQLASAVHVVTADNRDCSPTNSCAALLGTSWYSGYLERDHLAIANWNPAGGPGVYYPAPIADFEFIPVLGGPSYAYLTGPEVELPFGAAFNVLTVRGGGGALSCIYRHFSTVGNIVGNTTFLDELALNSHPDAFVLVLPYTFSNPANIGVFYDSSRLQWGIFNEDLTAMDPSTWFTVYDDSCDIGLGNRYHLTCVGTIGNECGLGGLGDGDPGAKILVTQRWQEGAGVYNPHPIGVYYAAGTWKVFNEDLAVMPAGVHFNVADIRVLLNDDFESADFTAWTAVAP